MKAQHDLTQLSFTSAGWPFPAIRPRRGVALIIVLAMLVLLSGLIVSFMSTVGNERAASTINSGSGATRQIADSTVNLVMAQIREATSQGVNNASWASQPGAIRTFSGKLQAGNTVAVPRAGGYAYAYNAGTSDMVYKLYSADKMKVKASDYASDIAPNVAKNEVGVIENWDRTSPTRDFVDLNEPILSLRSDLPSSQPIVEPRYPIVDPRARLDKTEGVVTAANTFGIVEGFDCKTGAKLTDSTLKMPDVTGGTNHKPVPYLPMPVKWLYVLRDGNMAAADTSSGKVEGANASNPIVGRTAFWADDESCKLNINTASEGVFWDTPSVSSAQEAGYVNFGNHTPTQPGGGNTSFCLASAQPAQQEYQRYPGHPATTSLSPALGWMWDITPTTSTRPALPTGTAYAKYKEAIYAMAPFIPVGKGTSAGAGVGAAAAATAFPGGENLPGGTDNPERWQKTGPAPDLKPIPYKPAVATKALYATVDELLYKRNPTSATAIARMLNSFTNTSTTLGKYGGNTGADITSLEHKKLVRNLPGAIEKMRFVLTANSRAPELNLFGQPRVTIWPVNATTQLRTPSDDLFAFASTIGGTVDRGKGYYFLRTNAQNDRFDYDGITGNRNVALMNYLRAVTGDNNRPIPGFGSTFVNKYGYTTSKGAKERDQILTEIFDYIRSVNLVDTGFARGGGNYKPYTPFYGTEGTDPYQRTIRSADWSAQVTPIAIDKGLGKETKGLGRFVTITEAALLFQRVGTRSPATDAQPQVQAVLIFEMTTPMPGYPAIRETYWTRVRENTVVNGLRQPPRVTLNTTPTALNKLFNLANRDLLPPGSKGMINLVNVGSHEVMNGRSFLPTLGAGVGFVFFEEHKNFLIDPTNTAEQNKSYTVRLKSFFNTEGANAANTTYTRTGLANVTPGTTSATKYTATNYPYVSDRFTVGDATTIMLDRTTFEIEIHAGEGPGDPKGNPNRDDPDGGLVQTITLTFPTVTVPIPAGVKGQDTDLRIRFPNVSSDKGAHGDFIRADDVVRSVEMVGSKDGGSPYPKVNQQGDIRLAMVRKEVPESFFEPRGGAGAGKPYMSSVRQVHGLQYGHADNMTGYNPPVTAEQSNSVLAKGGRNRWRSTTDNKIAMLPAGIDGVQRLDATTTQGSAPGDYDRGLSKHMDGAFGNKVDEGNVDFDWPENGDGAMPYFRGRNIKETGQTFFSPNRMLSSAVMFGSLPSGALEGKPWQTLLFRPDREKAGIVPTHPGALLPPDHLLLDLFNLPIVEPYAISEPFSTAGKVNLNFVIAPFGYAKGESGKNFTTTPSGAPLTNDRSYLRRDTALRGVLKAVKLMAVPTTMAHGGHDESPSAVPTICRFDIDPNLTLEQFEDRFKDSKRGLFRSASEICDVDLFPFPPNIAGTNGVAAPSGNSGWSTFWANNAATGDNMRERPYSMIYPRVTTKSNVFTVHMRCQALKKAPGTPTDEFVENRDQVLGEYRGSATIERFIDPTDPKLKDYDELGASPSLDPYYRFRVISTKQFAPK